MQRPSRLVACIGTVLLAAVGLTGCASDPGSGGCTPQVGSGAASASVKASGGFGTAPSVTFDAPLHVQATQASTLIRGSGAPIVAAQQIVADITILNASTGAVVTKTEYGTDTSSNAFVVKNIPVAGLRKALVCAQAGERLAAVIPPSQGIAESSRPESLGADDDIVVVVDVRRAYLARANGTNQVMAGGLPSVVLGADGRPGITLPSGAPPSTLTVADLKAGSGVVVRRGDTAVVHYTGVLWKPGNSASGTVFDSSWANGSPVALPLKSSSVIRGLVAALAGQRVGSQVLVVIPPSQAYGQQSSSTIPAGSTLVFVVDILGKA